MARINLNRVLNVVLANVNVAKQDRIASGSRANLRILPAILSQQGRQPSPGHEPLPPAEAATTFTATYMARTARAGRLAVSSGLLAGCAIGLPSTTSWRTTKATTQNGTGDTGSTVRHRLDRHHDYLSHDGRDVCESSLQGKRKASFVRGAA